jgi:hypothetical protein
MTIWDDAVSRGGSIGAWRVVYILRRLGVGIRRTLGVNEAGTAEQHSRRDDDAAERATEIPIFGSDESVPDESS